MDISPAQCRAARALLNITQDELAQSSQVSKRAIAGFELEKTVPIKATRSAIQRALELAGVRFTATGVEEKN